MLIQLWGVVSPVAGVVGDSQLREGREPEFEGPPVKAQGSARRDAQLHNS